MIRTYYQGSLFVFQFKFINKITNVISIFAIYTNYCFYRYIWVTYILSPPQSGSSSLADAMLAISNFFRTFNRYIGSLISNLESMIAKSRSAFSKTPVFQFWIQFSLFAYFSLPYCIRHFEFRKSIREILISDLENPCI